MKLFSFISLILYFGVAVSASDVQEAVRKGDYEDAINMGTALGTADGLYLAARAALINGGYHQSGDDSARSLHQALDLIHRAESLDAKDPRIQLTKAMAIGFEAKRRHKLKLAKQSRNIMRQLALDFPDDQMTIGALAAWHSEVAAEGFLARTALGARRKTAERLFNEAEQLDGDQSIAFGLEHAKYWARRGPKKFPQALKILAKIDGLESHEAFENTLKSLALSLRIALASGDHKDIQHAIEQATPFNGIEKWKTLAPWRLAAPTEH